MIEQALVTLVQGDAGVSGIAATGGYSIMIPKGTVLPTWSYTVISDKGGYTLAGADGLETVHVQIDCYGNTAAERILLAEAIDAVLDGYSGTIYDPSSPMSALAVIRGVFRLDKHDFFDFDSRTFRRLLEYELWFNQN